MVWTDQATSHNLNRCWPSWLTHISVTRPQYVRYSYIPCQWTKIEIIFIAVNNWKSYQYITQLGVSDLKPQLRGLPLTITKCGSIVSYDEELAYTFQCPASGITGRYVVLQSIGELEQLLIVHAVIVYVYGKTSNTHLNKNKLDNYGDQIEINADSIISNMRCFHQSHCYSNFGTTFYHIHCFPQLCELYSACSDVIKGSIMQRSGPMELKFPFLPASWCSSFIYYIDGLALESSNTIANAPLLLQSKPSMYWRNCKNVFTTLCIH